MENIIKSENLNDLNKCPYCGSVNISCDIPEVNGKYLTLPVSCSECDSEWDEIFSFKQREDSDGKITPTE